MVSTEEQPEGIADSMPALVLGAVKEAIASSMAALLLAEKLGTFIQNNYYYLLCV